MIGMKSFFSDFLIQLSLIFPKIKIKLSCFLGNPGREIGKENRASNLKM